MFKRTNSNLSQNDCNAGYTIREYDNIVYGLVRAVYYNDRNRFTVDSRRIDPIQCLVCTCISTRMVYL